MRRVIAMVAIMVLSANNLVAAEQLYELSYDDATAYYTPSVATRRRALDWWLESELLGKRNSAEATLDAPYDERDRARRIRLFGSTTGYTAGGAASYFRDIERDTTQIWSIDASLDIRGGRDITIEGVARQDLRAELAAQRTTERSDLRLAIELPALRRDLQSSAPAETFALTKNNLYNPAWGIDNGEVRNARTTQYNIPKIEISHQFDLRKGGATSLQTSLQAKWGRRSITRLGWYDGENPSPDYYRNLPSSSESTAAYDALSKLWSESDLETTQISWSRLRAANSAAQDGVANYFVESQVERKLEAEVAAIFTTRLIDSGVGRLEVSYGAEASLHNNRLFKEMEDLLGARHYIDYDSYTGDEVLSGTTLQNNLLNPDAEIAEGDRFGYDYSRNGYAIRGVLGLSYTTERFNASIYGAFGEQTIWRRGHYEKERFAGALSLGDSQRVTMGDSRLDIAVSHAAGANGRVAMNGAMMLQPASSRDIFLQEQNANIVVGEPSAARLTNIDAGYYHAASKFTLSAAIFYTASSNQRELWQIYDDASHTYCDVAISDIATRSYGIEVAAKYLILPALTLDATLSAGKYRYVGAPKVALYNDDDMSFLGTTTATAIDGCAVGNAPQILATTTLTWRVKYGFNIYLNASYAGERYAAPSIFRRTEMVLNGEYAPEIIDEIVAQENLGSVVDLSISLYKSFYIRGKRLAINASASNLLGDKNRISYAREANRVFTSSIQQSRYTYAVGRSLYVSCSYDF